MKLKKRLILTFCLLGLFLMNTGFTVVGHRGDPSKYPEETIQSDTAAFADGAEYVELDLHLSKDNVLVVSHDRNLMRVTGSSLIVSQNDFATLSQLKQANGELIMSLDQLFDHFQNQPNTKFLLETKKTKHNNPKNMERLLVACIERHHMQNRVMIHSFSAQSLKTMSELLPKVPRLFIVGSLKRINFKVLSYVSGVNLSVDMIKEDPSLVPQLHAMGKKVYVWAEMNESPELWNWLINNNVDGVVTNFPALGYRYKLAKSDSHEYNVQKNGIYLGRYASNVVENPYIPVKTGREVTFLKKLYVRKTVIVKGKSYDQIGNAAFLPASLVSLDLDPKLVSPYWSLSVISRNHKRVTTYAEPNLNSAKKEPLVADTKYAIWGFNGGTQDLWLFTSQGWIQAKKILFYGWFDQNSMAFWHYLHLPLSSRYTNIQLLPYNPIKHVHVKSWSKTQQQIQHLTSKFPSLMVG